MLSERIIKCLFVCLFVLFMSYKFVIISEVYKGLINQSLWPKLFFFRSKTNKTKLFPLSSFLRLPFFSIILIYCTFSSLLSRVLRKPAFCICENKDTDQLRDNREADQRLCFRHTDSTIPLLPIYEILSLKLSSVVIQPGLCGPWSETPKTGFLITRLNCCSNLMSLGVSIVSYICS